MIRQGKPMLKRMRIIFMGTPDFAVPALQKLYDIGAEIPLVVTKPDRPAGRGKKMHPCAVKELALELGLPVISPEKIRDNPGLHEQFERAEPDFIIVAAYGKILPRSILDIPEHGCLNIHASLLPKYRGAAPIQRAVLAGEKISGISIMYMAEEMDAGDIIAQRAVNIEGKSSDDLFEEFSVLGAELLAECLPLLFSGESGPPLDIRPQNHVEASYAPMISKDEAAIDWSRSATQLQAHVLGMYSRPVASTLLEGELLKVHRARAAGVTEGTPGMVVEISEEGIGVACGDGRILLLEAVQAPGRRAMSAAEFLRGRSIEIGVLLG